MILKLTFSNCALEQINEIPNEFDQQISVLRSHGQRTLDPIIDLYPHGLMKVLKTPTGFPGLLITVDIRALVGEVQKRDARCVRLADALRPVLLKISRGLGIVGAGGNICVPLMERKHRSPAEDAICLVACMALSIGNGDMPRLPLALGSDRYPSLSILCKFWCDFCKPLELAGRAITESACRQERFNFGPALLYWQKRLGNPPEKSLSIAPMNRAAIILSILSFYKVISTTASQQKAIASSLMSELHDDRKHLFRIAAIYMIGKCFSQWEAFVDGESVLRVLLAWVGKPRSGDAWSTLLITTSRECIHNVIICNPSLLNTLCADMLTGTVEPATTLSVVFELVQSNRVELNVYTLTETLVKLLDPANGKHRARMLPIATPLLYALVQSNRTLAFAAARQLLAYGRTDGLLVIWDVKTASRIHKIEMHKHPITCVRFDPDGGHIVTWCRTEEMLALCKIEEPSAMALLSSMVHSQAPAVKHIPVPPIISDCLVGADEVELEWHASAKAIRFQLPSQEFIITI